MQRPPKIVGIVNITEDSFSDGGRFLKPGAAVQHALELSASGADFLELGPASSHPDSEHVSGKLQIERLVPVLDALSTSDVPISIDATNIEVLRCAIEARVAMINDIRGFPDDSLYSELADGDSKLVVVHSLLERERASRESASPTDVLKSIDQFFEDRLTTLCQSGISEDRLIVDPGMGFFLGGDAEASVAVLRGLPALRARFGRPIFISVSRKSFLRKITGREIKSIGPATLAAELFAAQAGADYIRTHDVAALRDALEVMHSLQ